jgi:DMSO/TMAO reductase YedYZ molybdopterin-dependent catalytic subunit
MRGMRVRSALLAAVAGMLAGGVALGVAELVAGLVPGAPSPVIEIGALLIAFQPRGAQQLVVSILGTADKPALIIAVATGGVLVSAGLGILARSGTRLTWGLALAGFAALGVLALVAALRDPLADPVLALGVFGLSLAITWWVLSRLMRLAAAFEGGKSADAEMPDWSRRRFIGNSLTVGVTALAAGAIGRTLLTIRDRETASVEMPPAPVETAPPLPAGASLDVAGITPLVGSNSDFYRIDTQLFTPRLSATDWKLTVTGMVDKPLTLTYPQLLAMPLYEEYITIQCVSNEVGGDLVGNALWRGARLREVLNMAGIQPGATQIVGRSFDGWTAGFPTSWLTESDREALIVVAMNGQPLPPAHGYPARLMVPGLYGYVSATKWLTNIELTTLQAFDAYWVPLGWSKLGPIKTASRIDVPSPASTVQAGTVAVAGVAWAPDRGISKVELQVDNGEWQKAQLSTPISKTTWVQWLVRWQAVTGNHQLRVRATDGTGALQVEEPHDPAPDGATGYHTIPVTVS